MSIKLEINQITDDVKRIIDEDLNVTDVVRRGRKSFTNYYQFYHITDDDKYCMVPFSYGIKSIRMETSSKE